MALNWPERPTSHWPTLFIQQFISAGEFFHGESANVRKGLTELSRKNCAFRVVPFSLPRSLILGGMCLFVKQSYH